MKGNTSQSLLPKRWTRGHRRQTGAVFIRDCVLLFLGSFLLSGAQVRGEILPLGACLTAALPLGLRSVAAACGAVTGSLIFAQGTGCLELLALTVLMLAAVTLFQGTGFSAKRWFMPAMTAGVCALLKGIEVMGGSVSFGAWLLHWTSGGLFCAVFRGAIAGDRKAKPVTMAALVCGLAAVPGAVNLGLLCAVALSVWTGNICLATVFGVTLELAGGAGCAAAISAPALLCRGLSHNRKSWDAAIYLLGSNLILLLLGAADWASCFAVAAGTAAGLLLSRFPPFPLDEKGAGEDRGRNLRTAAEVMELLRGQLPDYESPACVGEAESVFDGAAERVCRCCERFHRCWQHRAEETYEALSSAARPIIERGLAQSEDLPQEFQNRCCHLEGFITAVNQELEGMLFRRRYRMQLEESRQVVAQQMECMAELFRTALEERRPQHRERAHFLPRVGICTKGKNGSSVSGDRGACFAGLETDYFILLCDGMGTGVDARRMSGETVGLLERMLKAGLDPCGALKLLNGVELLRGDDRYTTVDLLHLNLAEGSAVLYKWGAAPSYIRQGEDMKKIGTASPPPGVGVGGEHVPERYELSLKEGELLVMTSDGAGGVETESVICMYHGSSPQELAALLISQQKGEDDMSAVVVSLQPYAS